MSDEQKKKQLYITTTDGQPFKIPPDGSLGLLALGYKGLIAWRQVRGNYQKFLKDKESVNIVNPEEQKEPGE